MPLSLDLTDSLARFPIAYGYQPVRGWPVKHYETGLNQSLQLTKQHALGEGPWDGVEKLYADAFEILPADYVLHNGTGTDPADALFPGEEPHLWTAHISARCPSGITASQADQLFGIYRTLRTPNFNGAGVQIDSLGAPVGGGDPRDYYFFKPNPANAAVDQLLRWGQRLPDIVNFPAFVDWRDFNDELIPWDDAKYTPRSLSLTPAASGSLTPGNTYYVRVATVRSADVSSASRQSVEVAAGKITLAVGQTSVQVNWLIKGDEKTPAAPPSDITAFRVYVGTTPGVWLGYFTVSNPALRTLLVTTTAGTTAGSPLEVATSGLLHQIKRFECGLFFVPPYSLASALDSICQISCADWQWSGFGTATYRNDKVRFLSPATRTPVFTLDLAQVAPGTFKTWPVDRRSRPNQIIGNWRDRDDEFLNIAAPVVLNREQLQAADGIVKSKTIEFGTVYRSQVQRGVSFYARMLCDLDQMAAMTGSPKTYHVLPADVVYVTNTTPDWEDVQFMVNKKSENVETNIGDPLSMQIYTPGIYSDSDHSPLPLPLRQPRFDPFSAPPVATSLVLVETLSGALRGDFVFGSFSAPQRARVYLKRVTSPVDTDFHPMATVLPVGTVGFFELPGLADGNYQVKVVTESVLGISAASGHPVGTITLHPLAMSNPVVFKDGSDDWLIEAQGNPGRGDENPEYVCEVWRGVARVPVVSPADPARTLAMIVGTTKAAMLIATVSSIFTDPIVVTDFAFKNNLFPEEFGFTGTTLQKILSTYQRFDFSMKWGGADGEVSVSRFVVALQTLSDESAYAEGAHNVPGDFNNCPLSVSWTLEEDNLAGTVRETYRHYNTVIATRNNVDPGFGSCNIISHEVVDIVPGRPGPRYSFVLNGNELIVFKGFNPAGGNIPVVKVSLNPIPFPLRLTSETLDTNVMVRSIVYGGATIPGTIYARREQVEDFGSPRSTLYLRLYQKSRVPGIQGIPLDLVVP